MVSVDTGGVSSLRRTTSAINCPIPPAALPDRQTGRRCGQVDPLAVRTLAWAYPPGSLVEPGFLVCPVGGRCGQGPGYTPSAVAGAGALVQAGVFPRLRFMGSKYRLLPRLAEVFAEVGGRTALDAFSGSGVVSYLLKAQGYQVTANDFMAFPGVIAEATSVNQSVRLSQGDIQI